MVGDFKRLSHDYMKEVVFIMFHPPHIRRNESIRNIIEYLDFFVPFYIRNNR